MLINRKRLRLKDYDYSQPGAYFLTICTKDRCHYFGDIVNGEMKLSKIGQIASEMWKGLNRVYKNVLLDQFVVMPNHIHGIIGILENEQVGNASKLDPQSPTKDRSEVNNPDLEFNAEMHSLHDNSKSTRSKMLLSSIVKEYKSEVTRRVKRIEPDITKSIWQRSFYDRIIRTEREFENIQIYIYYNPFKWELDIENKMLTTKSERDKYYNSIFNNKSANDK